MFMLMLTGGNNITGWLMCWSRWSGVKEFKGDMGGITYRKCIIISGCSWESI